MIAKWIIVGSFVFGSLTTIATIGRERKPIKPADACAIVALNAAHIVAIVIWWQP